MGEESLVALSQNGRMKWLKLWTSDGWHKIGQCESNVIYTEDCAWIEVTKIWAGGNYIRERENWAKWKLGMNNNNSNKNYIIILLYIL